MCSEMCIRDRSDTISKQVQSLEGKLSPFPSPFFIDQQSKSTRTPTKDSGHVRKGSEKSGTEKARKGKKGKGKKKRNGTKVPTARSSERRASQRENELTRRLGKGSGQRRQQRRR